MIVEVEFILFIYRSCFAKGIELRIVCLGFPLVLYGFDYSNPPEARQCCCCCLGLYLMKGNTGQKAGKTHGDMGWEKTKEQEERWVFPYG